MWSGGKYTHPDNLTPTATENTLQRARCFQTSIQAHHSTGSATPTAEHLYEHDPGSYTTFVASRFRRHLWHDTSHKASAASHISDTDLPIRSILLPRNTRSIFILPLTLQPLGSRRRTICLTHTLALPHRAMAGTNPTSRPFIPAEIQVGSDHDVPALG